MGLIPNIKYQIGTLKKGHLPKHLKAPDKHYSFDMQTEHRPESFPKRNHLALVFKPNQPVRANVKKQRAK